MRILFVLQSIGYGGSMTSMINLLSLLEKYNNLKIDVLIMDPYGELYEEVNKVAHICDKDKVLEAVTLPRKKIKQLKKMDLYLKRLILFFGAKLMRKSTIQYGFEKAAKKYDNKYDCVIAYQESIATNFVQYIQSKKKIAWVHNDYVNVLKLYTSKEKMIEVYKKFNKIVCVSEAGYNNFTRLSGLSSQCLDYIYNTLPVDEIKRKSEQSVSDILQKNIQKQLSTSELKLVSSGRFTKQKRFDRLVDAAIILNNKGYRFKWFVLGNGELYQTIAQKIKENHLEENIILVGGLRNPFPLIQKCDLFVLTSDFEAHPMVANEALILGKPVITTDFESAGEVVLDNINGLITKMNPESIADAIQKLINNKELFGKLKKNAENFTYSNEDIVSCFFKLLN